MKIQESQIVFQKEKKSINSLRIRIHIHEKKTNYAALNQKKIPSSLFLNLFKR